MKLLWQKLVVPNIIVTFIFPLPPFTITIFYAVLENIIFVIIVAQVWLLYLGGRRCEPGECSNITEWTVVRSHTPVPYGNCLMTIQNIFTYFQLVNNDDLTFINKNMDNQLVFTETENFYLDSPFKLKREKSKTTCVKQNILAWNFHQIHKSYIV